MDMASGRKSGHLVESTIAMITLPLGPDAEISFCPPMYGPTSSVICTPSQGYKEVDGHSYLLAPCQELLKCAMQRNTIFIIWYSIQEQVYVPKGPGLHSF